MEVTGLLCRPNLSSPLASSLDLSLDAFFGPLGMRFSCLLVGGDAKIEFHQRLGQWLMVLLFLGMFGGLGVIFQHTVSTRPPCPHNSPFDPTKGVTSGIKTFMTLSSQGQEWLDNDMHTDHFVTISRGRGEN